MRVAAVRVASFRAVRSDSGPRSRVEHVDAVIDVRERIQGEDPAVRPDDDAPVDRVDDIGEDDAPIRVPVRLEAAGIVRPDDLRAGVVVVHEVPREDGPDRALGGDPGSRGVHDRVVDRGHAGRAARVVDVDVAELDAGRMERAAGVRVDVVPEDRHVVDVAVRLDPVEPLVRRIEADVVRLDVNVGRALADPEAVRMLGVLDGVVSERHMLRREDRGPVADLERLPLVRPREVRDPVVLHDHVEVRGLDPDHHLRRRVQVAIDEPVADHEWIGRGPGPTPHAVRGGEVGVRQDRDRPVWLELRRIDQPVTRRRSRASPS